LHKKVKSTILAQYVVVLLMNLQEYNYPSDLMRLDKMQLKKLKKKVKKKRK